MSFLVHRYKIIKMTRFIISFFIISLLYLNFSNSIDLNAAKKKSSSKVSINLPQTLILKEFIKIISEKTSIVISYGDSLFSSSQRHLLKNFQSFFQKKLSKYFNTVHFLPFYQINYQFQDSNVIYLTQQYHEILELHLDIYY